MNLRDGTVVVTGASRGIGAGTARALGERNTHVHLLARTESDLHATAADVRDAGGEATVHTVGLTDGARTRAIADRVRDETGRPDAVVNVAGTG